MKSLGLLCVAAFALAAPAAAISDWTSGGPAGGQITSLLVDPTSPSALYAGSRTSGVFRSTDGGMSWSMANVGLSNLEILCLTMDPVTTSILFAGTSGGVFKSTDSAGSWTASSAGLPISSIRALAVDPSTPATLYAGGFGNLDGSGNYHGIFKSTDGGGTWITTNFGAGQIFDLDINALRIDPASPSTLYAATSGAGVVQSADGGLTWTSPTLRRPTVDVLVITLDSMSPANLYATTGGRVQVFSSTDRGTSWGAGGSGLSPSVMVNAIAADPSTPSTLYAASQLGGMLKSADSGATWTGINQGLPPSTSFLSLAIDPVTPSTIYAGAAGTAVWKSTDAGASWVASQLGLNADPVVSLDVDLQDPLTAYAGLLTGGSFKTSDGGGSWVPLSLSGPGDFVPAIAIAPSFPSTVYSGVNAAVVKSTDSGTTWAAVIGQCAPAGCPADLLQVDPTVPDTVYAIDDFFQGIDKSTVGGATWSALSSGLLRASSVRIDPTSSANVFAGGEGFTGSVSRSTDGGNTWTSSLGAGASVLSLAIDPTAPSVVYAGATSGWPSPQPEVWKTTDAGGTWVNSSSGLNGAAVSSLAMNALNPAVLYAATEAGGIFLSRDAGASWAPFDATIPSLFPNSVFVDPMSYRLYVGADSGGVLTLVSCFSDVLIFDPFRTFICTLARDGVTAGCGAGNFCPSDSVLRSQMGVFLLRGEHGSAYVPPAAVGIFGDVPASNPFAAWIEELYNEGITSGCGTNPLIYCPDDAVTRASMAVLLLRAQNGSAYTPPACAGIFSDVGCPGAFTDWIEALYAAGITGGCATNPLKFCPDNSVTRSQMAVFLTVTFGLP